MSAIEGRQVPINSANKKQLREFAKELGVSVTNFDDEQKIITKIQASGYEESFIVVADGGVTQSATSKSAKPGAEVPEPMVELTIHQQEGAGGKRAVFVAVNGRGILIPRNQKVPVKLRYLRALENAIETKYELDEETKINQPRDLPSYPFQVHKMPSDEAIEAYRKWYAADEARLNASTKAA